MAEVQEGFRRDFITAYGSALMEDGDSFYTVSLWIEIAIETGNDGKTLDDSRVNEILEAFGIPPSIFPEAWKYNWSPMTGGQGASV